MACWPQQMLVTSGEGRGRLASVNAREGGDEQHLDLCTLAREAVSLLRTTGHVEPTEVQLELPDEPVFARVNPWRMAQVLFHLIADAVGARRGVQSTSSTRAVRLSVEPQDDFGDYGPTFRVRYAERARAEQETAAEGSRETDLAVARELLESLGGRLTAKSHGLTGRTLSVELPDQGTASW